MAEVRVILNQNVKGYPPGYKFNLYGHQFTVQKNGTAAAMIDESFLKNEIASGRYILPNKTTAEPTVLDTRLVDSYGYDIGQYYGAGSLEKLRKRIEGLRKAEIMFFAETRLGKKFSAITGKDRMVFEVIEAVKEKTVLEPEPDSDTECTLDPPLEEKAAPDSTSDPEVDPTPAKETQKPLSFELPDIVLPSRTSKPHKKSREQLLEELDDLQKRFPKADNPDQ